MANINTYAELRERQQREVNSFPMAFAFNERQFEEGMEKLGLKPTDTDKVYALPGTGGFYRRSDAEALHDMMDRHARELQEAIAGDTDGTGFTYEMFLYELANHEYCYTGDIEATLDACGLSAEDANNSPILQRALGKAAREYLSSEEIA